MSYLWESLAKVVTKSTLEPFGRFWNFLVKHDKWVYVGLALMMITGALI